MARSRHENVRERKALERRVWRGAFALSVVVHAVIFLFGPRGSILLSSADAAGPSTGDIRAADGTMTVIPLSSAPPAPIPRPAAPIVSVDVAVPELNTTQPVLAVSADLPEIRDSGVGSSSGGDAGDVSDVGIRGGAGSGNAGSALAGRSRLVPPSPRGIILPPTNDELRGRQIEVWVFVNERGQVVPDSTRLQPPTSDPSFNQLLMGEAARWIFEPARQDGAPVAAWFPYTISME